LKAIAMPSATPQATSQDARRERIQSSVHARAVIEKSVAHGE
jgi:hypothetical protein